MAITTPDPRERVRRRVNSQSSDRPTLCLVSAASKRIFFLILMKRGFPPWWAAECGAARAQSGNERPEGLGVFTLQHIEET